MQLEETASVVAGATPRRSEPRRSELQHVRAEGRRQAMVIGTLSEAICNLSIGARALKAENSELRAEIARLRGPRRRGAHADADANGAELAEVEIPVGSGAPGVARSVVDECLADQVRPSVLENARLIVSELVTNSVRHSGAAAGDQVVVRVHLWRDLCRLEVEDPGCNGAIAPHPKDLANGSGMGLNLVQMLSERWGVVRATEGPTRVWAQLSCAPAVSDERPGSNGGPPRGPRSA
jgi:anti-sigma regulatory factor (Ser/Thr protein kinase)